MRWLWLPWLVAGDLWDDEMWHELATRAVRLAREAGALVVLPLALGYRAVVHVHAGEFAAASALTEEADAITEATGNAPEVRRAAARRVARRRGRGAGRLETRASGTRIARGEGRAHRRRSATRPRCCTTVSAGTRPRWRARGRACEYEDLGVSGFALVELVEAAARSGAHEEAAAALRRLEERTERSRHGLGARRPGPVARAAERRRGRRLAVPRGDRTARAHPHRRPSRPRPPGVRRVAAPREPARRRPRAAAHRPRDVQPDRAPRRSPSAPAASSWPPARPRASAHVETRDVLTAAGGADRPARPRRADQPRDRRPAVHQPAHRRVPPAQGVPEA